MEIKSDIFASIEKDALLKLIDEDKSLKNFVDSEMERIKDEELVKQCGGCKSGCGSECSSGCGSGCGKKQETADAAYLTSALISIFNYYIPDKIKDSINLTSSTFIDEE